MAPSVSLGLIGPGLVGAAFLRQLLQQAVTLSKTLQLEGIRTLGVSNSKRMAFYDEESEGEGLKHCPEDWKTHLDTQGEAVDLSAFGSRLVKQAGGKGCCIMVDCTAGDEVPSYYVEFAAKGIHIVTSNKKFGAGPLSRYQSYKAACETSGSLFACEATVGAGLPVISTLKSLIETGDKVIKIEGILSGTLSYIFNTYRPPKMKFSEVVSSAKTLGYTEPDPREDLSGADVARKVVILARECGLTGIEMSGLRVESLVPPPLASLSSGDQYMERLPEYDEEMARKAADAESKGEVIRYIGRVDVEAGCCSVELCSVPADHPFANLSGTDNMIVFTTGGFVGAYS